MDSLPPPPRGLTDFKKPGLNRVNETDNTRELMEAHVRLILSGLPVSDQKLKDIKGPAEADLQGESFKKTILDGWLDLREECSVATQEYWNHRGELTILEDIIIKGDRIVIQKSLRKDMLHRVHCSHLGIEKCKRACDHDIVYWPGMCSEIEKLIQEKRYVKESRMPMQSGTSKDTSKLL